MSVKRWDQGIDDFGSPNMVMMEDGQFVSYADHLADREALKNERDNLDSNIASLTDCINEIGRQAGTGEIERPDLSRMRDAMWSVEYRRLALAQDRSSLLAVLRKAVEDSGHTIWCSARQGPQDEGWTVEEDCDCWVKYARVELGGT